ncbi:MAG: CoB--CoM heterodisulfide reductase iron-sulfur subunit A family protein [Anaerolineales bacterium]
MKKVQVDALVVGGGISGMQSALDLADQGYQVALVEKDASIGGKMIALSKVFPTLDCCSCITTPRMSAVAHHENIQLFTYHEVQGIQENENGFLADVLKKPRFVNEDTCTGCRQCEYACPINIPNPFDLDYGATKTVRVPFSTAVPQLAVLDIENCIFCGKCEKVCPTDAIDFSQQPIPIQIEAKAIILATGFETTSRFAKKEYNAEDNHNVISAMFMERLLAPTGPYGRVIRPGDGKEPDSIAYIQCAGSRDTTLGVEYCSRVCCMYAIKQAMLLAGSLPLADITIYYMDIRTFGKGYEQFYQNAKTMGIQFIKGKVASIKEDENQNPVLRVELIDEGSQVVERTHDLAVLSVGLLPSYDHEKIYQLSKGDDGFINSPHFNTYPCWTDRTGIFAAGTASAPMGIVDSIVMAGSAAAEAAAFIENHKIKETTPDERENVYA